MDEHLLDHAFEKVLFLRVGPGGHDLLEVAEHGRERLFIHARQFKAFSSLLKFLPFGLQLWHVDTDYFKSWVHGRLNWDTTQPGAWHLPEDATDDYCRQLVNESVIISPNGKRMWKEHGANHYLDCEMLNASAAYMLQVHRLRSKGASEQQTSGRRVISKGVEI